MLLQIKDLKTYYRDRKKDVRAVDGVSFNVNKGEILGLVGESGCGKTTLVKSLIRVMAPAARIVSGEIILESKDLMKLTDSEMNKVRWRKISMIAQSAMNALDPVYRVGDQMVETFKAHTSISKAEALDRSAHLFSLVGLEHKRLQDYPHQLSGGMRQRVVIAMALALNPSLIIADEPTTALDVVVQDGIMKQLQSVQEELGIAMILVTHDISVVAEMAQRVVVMYAGKMVEIGKASEIFHKPTHPYTMGLLNAFPTLESAKGELISIPGSPPNLAMQIQGCLFEPRCPFSTEQCAVEEPNLHHISDTQSAACHYFKDAAELRSKSSHESTWRKAQAQEATKKEEANRLTVHQNEEVFLEVHHLKKWFPLNRGIISNLFGESPKVHAVDGVSFSIQQGEILGLAGESGSGKSTISEIISNLQSITDGDVTFHGKSINLKGKVPLSFRKKVQMVFQDPYETLNPRFTIEQTIMEPLRNFKIGDERSRKQRIHDALIQVELTPPERYLDRYPHELSGGQRQRVAIARGIVVEPDLLVADEPVSMLDVSIRAGVLNLFRKFQSQMGMSILYVSHDLATIRYICDQTAILYLGRIAEIGATPDVIEDPKHPYTRLLISAVPDSDPTHKREKVDARGEIPDAIDLPNGCRFHARCKNAMKECGWEGLDLKKMIDKRRMDVLEKEMDADPSEKKMLEGLKDMRKVGFNLHIHLGSSGLDPKAVMDYIRKMMENSGRTIHQAVDKIESTGNTIQVLFPKQEEPGLYELESGRKVACYLYR